MRASTRPSVTYLVHDVWDAAVARRIAMLTSAGAEVRLAGFRRGREAAKVVAGAPTLDLGATANGAFAVRAALVLWKLITVPTWAGRLGAGDVIVARSLELLTLGWALHALSGGRTPLVYECLDIHRLMLSDGLVGRLLRAWERFLLHRCALVLTSSPAFIGEYFEKVQGFGGPFHLVENKPVLPASAFERPRTIESSPPWRIGWFGMIRCAKSLDLLCRLVDALPGQVEVVIAGRVSEGEFDDFQGTVGAHPGVRFLGPYEPADLARLYGGVHFTWAIDFFEEGLNSVWLLPNRLYEGSAFGAVPLALEGVETGRWLARQGAGVLLPDDLAAALEGFFDTLTPAAYKVLESRVENLPRTLLVSDQADCEALVSALRGLSVAKPVL
jgi:succinoglycan biosynthesis protein ExoL